jgi:hypothetical protein
MTMYSYFLVTIALQLFTSAQQRECDAQEFLLKILDSLPIACQQLFQFTAKVDSQCSQCHATSSAPPVETVPDSLHLGYGNGKVNADGTDNSFKKNQTKGFNVLLSEAKELLATVLPMQQGRRLCKCTAAMEVNFICTHAIKC